MPDDPAFTPLNMRLGGADSEILVWPAKLLHAGVEDNKIVDQFQKAGLPAELNQSPVEEVSTSLSSFHVR